MKIDKFQCGHEKYSVFNLILETSPTIEREEREVLLRKNQLIKTQSIDFFIKDVSILSIQRYNVRGCLN